MKAQRRVAARKAPAEAPRREPPQTPDALRSYIPYLVNRLSNRISIDQNRMLAQHGLNNVVLRTLSVLHIYGTLTVNEISVLAVTEQSTASRTIDLMVESGLVTRQLGVSDQRRREVALTPKGEDLLNDAWPLAGQTFDKLADGIAPADIDTCARVLSRMIDNVRRHEI